MQYFGHGASAGSFLVLRTEKSEGRYSSKLYARKASNHAKSSTVAHLNLALAIRCEALNMRLTLLRWKLESEYRGTKTKTLVERKQMNLTTRIWNDT